MTKRILSRPDDGQSDWLESSLAAAGRSSVAVVGDFCLDAYWTLEAGEKDKSIETGLPVNRVVEQRYSPGGAGNVAANLKALGVPCVRAVGLVGRDIFGGKLRELLDQAGVVTDRLWTRSEWTTPVYAKPYLNGAELARFDFGSGNQMTAELKEKLAEMIEEATRQSTAVIVNQQLSGSAIGPDIVGRINDIIRRYPQVLFVVDTRDHDAAFEGAILKLNAREAARLCGEKHPLGRAFAAAETREHALRLTARTGFPVYVTRGAHGLMLADGTRVLEIPGIPVAGKTDSVGAGDTVVAAIAAVLGSDRNYENAGRLANLAASVTVRKLRTTSTASPAELRKIGLQPDGL